MIYIIILIAAIIASMTGIGGGIIIRPILSTTDLSVVLVNFYACIAILFSTIYSILRAYINKENIDVKIIIFLSIGSFVGGVIGNSIFNSLLHYYTEDVIIVIQSILLIFTLIFVLYATINKIIIKKDFTSKVLMIVIGTIIGIISVVIGIGGGILNVIVLEIFFKMKNKELIVNSLAMIFISQLTNAILMFNDKVSQSVDYSMLAYIIIVALIGGIIGKELTLRIKNEVIKRLFIVVITSVIFLNFYIIFEKVL